MTTADLFPTAAPPEESRRAEYDVDYTPRAIPRGVFEALAPELGDVRRILIPAAGAGSWAAEARARWPNSHIIAVEIRPEEERHLRAWCDVVLTGDIRAQTHLRERGLDFDLIADNPPFSLAPLGGGRKSQAECLRAFVVNLRPLLAPGGRLCLYHLSDLGQRSAEARAILEEHVPLYQMRHQPMRHRAEGGSDLRSYSTWVWGHDQGLVLKETKRSRAWLSWDMPALPAHERRWSVVPGTEAE